MPKLVAMSDLQRILNAQDLVSSLETLQKVQPDPLTAIRLVEAKAILAKCIMIFGMDYPLDMSK